MVMVEMAFSGEGGLEQLVEETARAVEMVLSRHALDWSPNYPVTLREARLAQREEQFNATLEASLAEPEKVSTLSRLTQAPFMMAKSVFSTKPRPE